jgi:hypothetical protein
MVKKLPIREWMKPVVNALMEGKKTWSDLKEIKIKKLSEEKERKIPDKTLDRILKEYLVYWGLVRKEDDYWVWYEQSRIFQSTADYDLAIEHSRKLIPTLRSMLNASEVYEPLLLSAAEEHLKSYPEIYQKHMEFDELFNQKLRKLFSKYRDRIKLPGRDFIILDPVTIKKEGFLGKLEATETKFKKRDVPYMIDWKGNLTEEQIKEIKELQAILDDKASIHKEFQLFRELAGDLSVLVLRTEMGTPLEGRCSLCPNVKILEKGVKP